MARPFPSLSTQNLHNSLPLSVGIFLSIFALVALCAKGSSKSRTKSPTSKFDNDLYAQEGPKNNIASPMHYKTPPRSPLATPKKLLANITNIKSHIVQTQNDRSNNFKLEHGNHNLVVNEEKDGFGEGGLWQKNILMGEKCQPLEFSGVIYYDNYGNKVSQIPRSPRASAVSLQGSML
ncbi:uncharacterized protein LOC130808529 [Amaranthus tricolor]|uniref:uncharacterized protein LOC130808529 n=1 Tax=Amaranthus tricolor TaxID=29722 RepID=UPI00258E6ECC|nr:uncharacterized protein LOC130808529 [Amaranthus tricolor]